MSEDYQRGTTQMNEHEDQRGTIQMNEHEDQRETIQMNEHEDQRGTTQMNEHEGQRGTIQMNEHEDQRGTTQMNEHEDQMVLISQMYPGLLCAEIATNQGDPKPQRRRRKKNKGGENGQCEGAKKRKLSEEQVNLLELNFGNDHKLESERKDRIASELGLDPRQVAVWFQNRRARWKNKKLEEVYNKLKSVHESVVLDKCRLEFEVVKLQEQVCEAEKEIQQLTERIDGVSSKSSSDSSVLSMDPLFQGDFGYGNIFHIGENSYVPGMEWMNLYM